MTRSAPCRNCPRHALQTVCWLFGLLVLTPACGPSIPENFAQDRAEARRAYAHGRYDEAARHWLEAADSAEDPHDHEEALYRAAASFERAGNTGRARALLQRIASQPKFGNRKARARFDRARLEIETGRRDLGYRMLEQALRAHPNSGVATGALRSYLRYLDDRSGPQASLDYLEHEERRFRGSDLHALILYETGQRLLEAGHTERARDVFLKLARAYPYPDGAYWDDALFQASLAEEKLGHFGAAAGHLRRMLAEREHAQFVGSYQRPRFDDAQFRLAELLRDRLNSPRESRKEFQKLFDEHETSRLRDDALWQAALLSVALGEHEQSCATLRLLTTQLPESRFVRCAHEVCPRLKPLKRACPSYIRRSLDSTAVRETPMRKKSGPMPAKRR